MKKVVVIFDKVKLINADIALIMEELANLMICKSIFRFQHIQSGLYDKSRVAVR